jgi:hypothetical protein
MAIDSIKPMAEKVFTKTKTKISRISKKPSNGKITKISPRGKKPTN